MTERCSDDCVSRIDRMGLEVKEHAKRNFTAATEPIARDVHMLMDIIRGGSDGKPGLAAKVWESDRRITIMEQSYVTTNRKLDDMLDEIRMMTITSTGKTPRNGTQVDDGSNGGKDQDEAGTTFKFTLPKKLWPWLVVVFFGGPAGVASVVSMLTQAPQSAVTVAAEGVVTMQEEAEAELDRAQRVAAEAEAKAASIVAAAEAKAAQTVAEAKAKAERERSVRPPPVAPGVVEE